MGERHAPSRPERSCSAAGTDRFPHTRHLIRAVMERRGVQSEKDTFTISGRCGFPVTSIRPWWRRRESPLWRQIQADVYAHEVEIVAAEEGAAYGAGDSGKAWEPAHGNSVDEACDSVGARSVAHRSNAEASKTMQSSYAHVPENLSCAPPGIRVNEELLRQLLLSANP